jgi:hypothetical protein
LKPSGYLARKTIFEMQPTSVFDPEYNLQIRLERNYANKVCPHLVINGRHTKTVTAYHSLRWDLYEAQEMILYLQQNPKLPTIVLASMFKAFIVQYTRCYTESKGRKISLNSPAVFKDQKDLLNVHNQVMDIRNKYIAHADESPYDFGAMVIYLNPDEKRPAIFSIIYTAMKLFDHSILLNEYIDICKRSLEFVDSKLEGVRPHYHKEVDAIDIQDLYKRSKTPNG